MDAEVEELLQRLQMLIGLLSPLAETHQHEVLLQVAFLLRARMEPRVLDGDRGAECKSLHPLHLLRSERAELFALREHSRADRLAVRHQRKSEQ